MVACLAVLWYGDDSTQQQLPAVVCGRVPTYTHTHTQFAGCVPGVQNRHYSSDYFTGIQNVLLDLRGLSASFPTTYLHICRHACGGPSTLARTHTDLYAVSLKSLSIPYTSINWWSESWDLQPLPSLEGGDHSNQPPACLTSIIPDQHWVAAIQHTQSHSMTQHALMWLTPLFPNSLLTEYTTTPSIGVFCIISLRFWPLFVFDRNADAATHSWRPP